MKPETANQPKLGDLLAKYLERQAQAHQTGLASFDPAEVTPYDAGPVQPIDAKLAWDEATAAVKFYQAAQTEDKLPAPPHWSGLVAGHEPAVALAFCLGNFPQLVRSFHMVLPKADLNEMKPQAGRPTPAPDLENWANQAGAKNKYPQVLLALGALRLAKQWEAATKFVEAHDRAIPETWRAGWDNEKAALAWHQGKAEEASALWDAQPDSVPVLFNRGMADLFLGRSASAEKILSQVVAQLPETSAWHHLAHLYLTLAQSRAAK